MAATTLAGFHNRVARIDLTTGSITYEPVDDELARKYLGGRGLGVKYVFDHGIHDPLSPAVPSLAPSPTATWAVGPRPI